MKTGRVPIGERGGAHPGAEGTEVGHQRKGGRPGGPPVPRALGKESRLHSSSWGQPPCCGHRAWEHVGGSWEHVGGGQVADRSKGPC